MLNKKDNGLLFEIYDHILKNSWYPQPELALSAALCALSGAIDRKITFEANVANIFCLNISPSASGKDAPQQVVKNIYLQCGMGHKLGAGKYVSEASIMDMLETQNMRVDFIDEAAGMLAVANSGNQSFNSGIGDTLCELYTSSNNYFQGRALAGGIIRGQCARPFVTMMMSTTPRGFQDAMSVRAIEKGLAGRTLLFFGDPEARGRRIEEDYSICDRLKDRLSELHSYEIPKDAEYVEYRKLSDNEIHPIIRAVFHNEEAREYADYLWKKYEDTKNDEDVSSPLRAIIGRGYQGVAKIALINCVGRSRDIKPPRVNLIDLKFAEKVIDKNIESFRKACSKYIFENKTDEVYMRIKNAIKENKSLSMSELSRKVRGVGTRQRREVIQDLMQYNLVTEGTKKYNLKGRLTTVYQWIGGDDA